MRKINQCKTRQPGVFLGEQEKIPWKLKEWRCLSNSVRRSLKRRLKAYSKVSVSPDGAVLLESTSLEGHFKMQQQGFELV